jgi:hypothetical protein
LGYLVRARREVRERRSSRIALAASCDITRL